MCTEEAKALVGKSAGATAQIKAVAPNYTSSHCSPQQCTLAVKNNKKRTAISPFTNVPDEPVRSINFIKL